MMNSNALATRRPGVWVFTYVYSFFYSVTIVPSVNMTRALSAVTKPRAKHTVRLPSSPPPVSNIDSELGPTPAFATVTAPAPGPGPGANRRHRPRPDHDGPWHAVEMAIEFSNLATWARVLTKVNMMGILPFMFETRLSECGCAGVRVCGCAAARRTNRLPPECLESVRY
jgi:hypothetical protein